MPCSPQVQAVINELEQMRWGALLSFGCAVMNSTKAQMRDRATKGAIKAEYRAAKRAIQLLLGVKKPTDEQINSIIPG